MIYYCISDGAVRNLHLAGTVSATGASASLGAIGIIALLCAVTVIKKKED